MFLNGVKVLVKSGIGRKEYTGVIIHSWTEEGEVLYEIRVSDTTTIVALHEEVTPIIEKRTGVTDKNGIPIAPGDTVVYKVSGTYIYKSGTIISISMMGITPYVLIKDSSETKNSHYFPAATVIRCANQLKNKDRDYINSGFFSAGETTSTHQSTNFGSTNYTRINASIYMSKDIKDILKLGGTK